MRIKLVAVIGLTMILVGSTASSVHAGGFLKKLFGKSSECCCEPAPEPECCELVCCEPVSCEPVSCEPASEPACCEPAPEPCCASTTVIEGSLVSVTSGRPSSRPDAPASLPASAYAVASGQHSVVPYSIALVSRSTLVPAQRVEVPQRFVSFR